MFHLWTTYSVSCISADRLTVGSTKLSPAPEESLMDRGLLLWGVYEISLSNSRSLASSLASFSRRIAVRLFFKVSSYMHSLLLLIWLHCAQTGRTPVHFCNSEINIKADAVWFHWLVCVSYKRGKVRERCGERRTHRQERQAEPRPSIPEDSDLRGMWKNEEFEELILFK